jgi:hypothetical protein
VSKKLQEKQRKRLAEEKRRAEMRRAARRRNLVTLILAIVVTAGVVWLIIDDRNAATEKNKVGPVGVAEAEAGCEGIEDAKPQEAKHIAQGAEHEDYNTNPPTSGPHYAAPLAPIDPGFYSNDIEPEKVVHNLEHGMIVVWYRPDAPQSTIDDVEGLTEQQPAATVAVPWSDIDAPSEIVLTAWGHLQPCVQVSQEVVDHFRTLYQGKGPEQVGVPTFEG